MFEDNKIRLQHNLDAAREAVSFMEEHHREDQDTDRKLNLSLVRLLEIISEAARGITTEFRREHPELPWKSMVGMRDRPFEPGVLSLIDNPHAPLSQHVDDLVFPCKGRTLGQRG